MKAIEISKNGGPEVLEIKDIKLSKPEEDEVTIEHRAIGLNYIDTYHRSGLYPLKLPSGIGAEGAGIIKEVGSSVKDFNVGDKVSYAGAPLGASQAVSRVHRVPPSISITITKVSGLSKPRWYPPQEVTERHRC